MTTDKIRVLIALLLITTLLIIYSVNKMIYTNEDKVLYIEVNIDENLYDDIIVNIELSRDSYEYSEYTEVKLLNINVRDRNTVKKIPLDDSFLYEIFVNYKNEKFFKISKDQLYNHLDIDIKNKFEIKEINNKIYLLDYGLYKFNEKHSETYDSYLLENKNLLALPDSKKYLRSSNENRFIVDPLDIKFINYFSKLPQSELEEFKFIPSDQKKIEELRK